MASDDEEQIARGVRATEDVTREPCPRQARRVGPLLPEERRKIQLTYLESGGALTQTALAARFAVSCDTVGACLKGPDFVHLQKQVEQELRTAAVARLKRHVEPAAAAWCQAIDVAGKRGDHRPARDLLLHTGTIEPLDKDGRGQGTLVLMAMHFDDGRPGFRDPKTGATYEKDETPRSATVVVQIGVHNEDVQLM
jgi:hypothetical protein